MATKKRTSTYEKLAKKIGGVTFASHLAAVVETDFKSRAECARRLGMTPQSLNDYMTARRIPTPKLAGEMAYKLGYPPIAFIEAALSDLVRKSGYKYRIVLESA